MIDETQMAECMRLLSIAAIQMPAAEPEWGPSRVKDCDRDCLVGVMDGTRRGAASVAPPGMLMNAMIMESFGIRGGKIHEGEAAPFVTIPCRLGDGWTEGSGS